MNVEETSNSSQTDSLGRPALLPRAAPVAVIDMSGGIGSVEAAGLVRASPTASPGGPWHPSDGVAESPWMGGATQHDERKRIDNYAVPSL